MNNFKGELKWKNNPVEKIENTSGLEKDKAELNKINEELELEINNKFIRDWELKEVFEKFEKYEGFENKKTEIVEELKKLVENKIQPEDNTLNISPERWNDILKETLRKKINDSFEQTA